MRLATPPLVTVSASSRLAVCPHERHRVAVRDQRVRALRQLWLAKLLHGAAARVDAR